MRINRAFVYLLILSTALVSCGKEKSSSSENVTLSEQDVSNDEGVDQKSLDSEVAEDNSLNDEETDENTIETPEGFYTIGGTWKVGGIYAKGKLVDINDVEAIKSMYDTTMITFNEDGSFVYLNIYNKRGSWKEKKQGYDNCFILSTESTFMYDFENGTLVERETETTDKKQYIVTLLDANTFVFNEYDSLTGKAKANDSPYIFVKSGESSEYLADNKTQISGSDKQTNSPDKKGTTPESSNTTGANVTSGEKNALSRALEYLNYTAFSYSGLIDQLEYEGYSHSESTYAADNCGADWNEQAVRRAKQYLEYSSFSRSALIEQLVFEGFTQSQAEYGVSIAY